MEKEQQILVSLLSLGLGNKECCEIPVQMDWEQVMLLSQMHGVESIVLDGIERSRKNDGRGKIQIPQEILLQWIGVASQQEQIYQKQKTLIKELADFYAKYSIRMMVLKGWGLSLNYPKPEHRNCSDLDIYLFGEQKKADKLLHDELGIEIDNSHHHHSVFNYKGLSVENHYDFLNVYSHLSSRKIEKRLKDFANTNLTNNTNIYLPSADFNVLFILRHTAAHFAGSAMNIRQILDWGLFVKRYHNVIDWDSLLPFIKEMNMHQFYDAQNYICYHYLGFDKTLFPAIGSEEYGERVFQDIFNPENTKPKEKGFVKYIFSRYKKWWGNRWKHHIVYSEGLFITFCVQVVSHLMKPATLRYK